MGWRRGGPQGLWLGGQVVCSTYFFFWFGITLTETAPYIMDARAQKLSLMSPFFFIGGEILHDWNFLLGQLHLLWADQLIGGFFLMGGYGVMLLVVFLIILPHGVILSCLSKISDKSFSNQISGGRLNG